MRCFPWLQVKICVSTVVRYVETYWCLGMGVRSCQNGFLGPNNLEFLKDIMLQVWLYIDGTIQGIHYLRGRSNYMVWRR